VEVGKVAKIKVQIVFEYKGEADIRHMIHDIVEFMRQRQHDIIELPTPGEVNIKVIKDLVEG